jgi:hypothetical protein
MLFLNCERIVNKGKRQKIRPLGKAALKREDEKNKKGEIYRMKQALPAELSI